jgi:enoyl-[acyl-carrier-protein] reductase (NADH)
MTKYYVNPHPPLGREQTAGDVGRAVVLLVSDDTKNITSQTLHVDE